MVDPGAPTGPMRRLCYQVAVSLDGFIAGPDDGSDWIPPEPTFDFELLHARFDTLLMGRRTWEIVQAAGEDFRSRRVVVASRTLRPEDHPGIEVVGEGLEDRVRALTGQQSYPGGMVLLQYDVIREEGGMSTPPGMPPVADLRPASYVAG